MKLIDSILNFISKIIITVRYYVCYLYSIIQWRLFLKKVDGFKEKTIENYKNYLIKKGADYDNDALNDFFARFLKEHILKSAESLTFFSASERELNNVETRFTGEEILRAKLAEGRGVILVTSHIGPYNLLPAAIFFDLGIETHFLTMAPEEKNYKHSKERAKQTYWKGLKFVYIGKFALVKCADILEKGGLLCVLPDLPGTFISGEEQYNNHFYNLKAPSSKLSKYTVSFLGEKTYAPAGLVYISELKNTPIVFGVICRYKRLEHVLSFKEVVFPNNASIEEKLEVIFNLIEKEIEKKPHEWGLWSHFHKNIVATKSM